MTVRNLLIAASGGAGTPSYWISEIGVDSGSNVATGGLSFGPSNSIYSGAQGNNNAGSGEYAWIIKRDKDGAFIWQKEAFTSNSTVTDVITTSDNGVLFGWTSGGFGKLSSAGNKVFYKYLSGATFSTRVTLDGSENIYVIGGSYVSQNKCYVAKLNSSGSLLWQKEYVLSGATSANGAGKAIDTNGNIYTCSTFYTSSTEYGCLVKFSTGGLLQWSKSYGIGSYALTPNNAAVTNDNNSVYCVGSYGSPTNKQAILLKLDSSGNVIWNRQIASGSNESFTTVAVDSNDNVYVLGSYVISSSILVKFDSSGTLQWQKLISNSSGSILPNNFYSQVMRIQSKNLIVSLSGTNSSYGESWSVPYVIKIPTDGTKTGTYNNITYADSAFPIGSTTVTVTSVGMTENTPAYTVVDSAATPTTGDWTNILTPIP